LAKGNTSREHWEPVLCNGPKAVVLLPAPHVYNVSQELCIQVMLRTSVTYDYSEGADWVRMKMPSKQQRLW
jgi:hypothetical protein